MRKIISIALMAILVTPATFAQKKSKNTAKPNILVIMADDIGISNLSYNNKGMMGYTTPNIDRIANEGVQFTDYYAEQSCTAGRSAFITGQMPVRTGLTKVGLPGADLGLRKEDPTLAMLLKPFGYATGQFGKNHLGDKNEFLPTEHGFDEFFGNLYHLNAEEAPEHENYPQNPEFKEKFGPRGVLKSNADGKVEDTGPLSKKRMETIDQEFLDATIDFIERKEDEDTPWFCWFNPSRMHYHTHVPDDYKGKSGLNVYADGMIQHDDQIGTLLNKLDELGITENTIVIYTTDNGVHFNMWPDAGVTPFRGEKNTNWEGGYRVPFAMRWPEKIKAGQIENGITSHTDLLPTLMAAVGENNIKDKLKEGHKIGNMTYKVHLDGYNLLPNLIDDKHQAEWPRKEFFYWSDDGDLVAYRYDRWKLVFMEQKAHQLRVWMEPFTALRVPLIFDLRMDPYERASTDANGYFEWMERVGQFLIVPAQSRVGEMVSTFKEFPPRQKPAKFNLEEVMNNMMKTP
ncbi:arylsulfatase [Carboxylicivirga sediminis]|uniref:Arylsulfatase n=1 Tax=Carboxylicivirga sediminis TaxID=2006564 RepID=A0A941IXR3_9BACT|nr:arylsulfatase [Carboxylicivirga sediminis]MBR8534972.1 arylsulfatase [Carboxylicivirga sediminis]